ncbi:putative U3 small nucleolar RNA-associated protein Utp11 [Cladophialophora carrionii]|uniref:U3 small nucleolar RNA-associated protein 11 n=1 Tax=Cladophialophora carrionii TaxID=86049 RepID=A0A1C1C712_9EURO|nr:putative U3 small nucleolar RNA-associated protein Utp11 [Cladophialophora carrionii]
MSSLRNAVSRRPHKERDQPAARQKWGILEKHKDYSLRAQDYNLKKKKLAQLSQKARERNPDEFAFGMIRDGHAGLGKHKSKHGDGDAKGIVTGRPLSHDAVKLLKTQDAGYLRTVAAKGRRELERLQEEVGMDAVSLGKGRLGKKTVFEDDETAGAPRALKRGLDGQVKQDSRVGDEQGPHVEESEVAASIEDQAPKAKSKKALQAEKDALTRLKAERKRRKRLQEMRVAKLEALKKRQREILVAADQLELQRAKMARTVGGVNKDGVRFKVRERKR